MTSASDFMALPAGFEPLLQLERVANSATHPLIHRVVAKRCRCPQPWFPSRMNAVDRTIIKSLREARRVVVLTGAGVSAESGVPTFRDKQAGLWESPDATCRDAVLQQEAVDCGWRNWSKLLPSWPCGSQLARSSPRVEQQ